MKYSDNEIIERTGLRFKITFPYDEDADLPWENGDCRGVVSEWERRDKKPCERILNTDRTLKRFCDVQASMEKAKTVWGITDKQEAAKAVDVDFEYLRQFCNDEWHYIVVCVDRLDDNDNVLASDSLGSVEDNSDDYIEEIVNNMIETMLRDYASQLASQAALDAVIKSMVKP